VIRGTIFYSSSTVVFTVLFSTAISQVLRFFGTVLVHCSHKVTNILLDCIAFQLKLQPSACILSLTAKLHTFYLFILCCFVV